MSPQRCLGNCEKYEVLYKSSQTNRGGKLRTVHVCTLQLVGVWEGCHVTVREGKCRECINIIHSEL